MADLDEIQELIEAALPGAQVTVEDHGGGDHLAALVIASQFEGMSRINQHKAVYAAVQARIDDGAIHALALKTRVPEA
ncbi:MAG: BolA/IbaG family iron-sulfur metabolism protein [Thermoleophilia bacterium]|nr:BolA/IbaG family iron-sulfur metabolism protein [Thermoleophilia bacterium]